MSEDGRYDTMLEGIDPGIRETVRILREHGVNTCQSCQGGAGHSYSRPTVDFIEGGSIGPWEALHIARNECPLELRQFRLQWGFHDERISGPTEMVWQLVFNRPPDGYQHDLHRVLDVELVNNAVICFEDEAIACMHVEDAREFARRIIAACDSQRIEPPSPAPDIVEESAVTEPNPDSEMRWGEGRDPDREWVTPRTELTHERRLAALEAIALQLEGDEQRRSAREEQQSYTAMGDDL